MKKKSMEAIAIQVAYFLNQNISFNCFASFLNYIKIINDQQKPVFANINFLLSLCYAVVCWMLIRISAQKVQLETSGNVGQILY